MTPASRTMRLSEMGFYLRAEGFRLHSPRGVILHADLTPKGHIVDLCIGETRRNAAQVTPERLACLGWPMQRVRPANFTGLPQLVNMLQKSSRRFLTRRNPLGRIVDGEGFAGCCQAADGDGVWVSLSLAD